MTPNDELAQPDFDAVSLHLVNSEIILSLRQIEASLRAFSEDEYNTAGLSQAPESMQQIEGILRLLTLEGAWELASVLTVVLQQLASQPENTSDEQLGLIGEGLEMLSRYLDFVLLHNQRIPHVLLPVINRLRRQAGQASLREGHFLQASTLPAELSQPAGSTSDLQGQQAQIDFLHRMFKAGLQQLLTQKPQQTAPAQALTLISRAAEQMAQVTSGSPTATYWSLVDTALQGLDDAFPLSDTRKRTLAAIERSFAQPGQLPATATVLDVLSLALGRNHPAAQQLAARLSLPHAPDQLLLPLHAKLYGPDQGVIHQVTSLLHEEIDAINLTLDSLARNEAVEGGYPALSEQMYRLGRVLQVLNCEKAAQMILQQSTHMKHWFDAPDATVLGDLMQAILQAENAITLLDQSYTPGMALMPLNNTHISLHQLDEARAVLITEIRGSLELATRALLAYMESKDLLNMQNVPTMLSSAGGALEFLSLSRGHELLAGAAVDIERLFAPDGPDPSREVLDAVADVITCIDYYLEGITLQKPTGSLPLLLGERSAAVLEAA